MDKARKVSILDDNMTTLGRLLKDIDKIQMENEDSNYAERFIKLLDVATEYSKEDKEIYTEAIFKKTDEGLKYITDLNILTLSLKDSARGLSDEKIAEYLNVFLKLTNYVIIIEILNIDKLKEDLNQGNKKLQVVETDKIDETLLQTGLKEQESITPYIEYKESQKLEDKVSVLSHNIGIYLQKDEEISEDEDYEVPKVYKPSTYEDNQKTFKIAFSNFYSVCFERTAMGVLLPNADPFIADILSYEIDEQGKLKEKLISRSKKGSYYEGTEDEVSAFELESGFILKSLQIYLKAYPFKFNTENKDEVFNKSMYEGGNPPQELEGVKGAEIINNFCYKFKTNFYPKFQAMCSQRLVYAYFRKKGTKEDTEYKKGDKSIKTIICTAREAKKHKGGRVIKVDKIEDIVSYAIAVYDEIYIDIINSIDLEGYATKIMQGNGKGAKTIAKNALVNLICNRIENLLYCSIVVLSFERSLIELKYTHTPDVFTIYTTNNNSKESTSINIAKKVTGKNQPFGESLKEVMYNQTIENNADFKANTNIKINGKAQTLTKEELKAFTLYQLAYATQVDAGSTTVGLTSNAQMYKNKSTFAWTQYSDFYGINKPGLSNILLGRSLDGTPYTIDIGNAQSARGIGIYAGSRAGKGVLTLSLLASFVGIGSPFIYLDCKPDMFQIMKQLQVVWGTEVGDSEFKLMSYDFASIGDKIGGKDVEKFSELQLKKAELPYRDLQEITGLNFDEIMSDKTYNCLRSLKVMYLFFAWTHYSAYKNEETKAIMIVDELLNASTTITETTKEIEKAIKGLDDKLKELKKKNSNEKNKTRESEQQEKLLSEIIKYYMYIYNTYLGEVKTTRGISFQNGKSSKLGALVERANTESLGKTLNKIIFISQKVTSYADTTFAKDYPAFLYPIVSQCVVILGQNVTYGTGSKPYHVIGETAVDAKTYVGGGKEEDSENTKEAISLEEQLMGMATGYFMVKTRKNNVKGNNQTLVQAKDVHETGCWSVFKPYMTLNENDIDINNPYSTDTGGKFTNAYKKISQSNGLDIKEVVDSDFIKEVEGKKVLEERVGLQGLCEYMYAILRDNNTLGVDGIEKRYNDKEYKKGLQKDIVEKLKASVERINAFIIKTTDYESVWDYINDFSTDSLWTYDMAKHIFNKTEVQLNEIGGTDNESEKVEGNSNNYFAEEEDSNNYFAKEDSSIQGNEEEEQEQGAEDMDEEKIIEIFSGLTKEARKVWITLKAELSKGLDEEKLDAICQPLTEGEYEDDVQYMNILDLIDLLTSKD